MARFVWPDGTQPSRTGRASAYTECGSAGEETRTFGFAVEIGALAVGAAGASSRGDWTQETRHVWHRHLSLLGLSCSSRAC